MTIKELISQNKAASEEIFYILSTKVGRQEAESLAPNILEWCLKKLMNMEIANAENTKYHIKEQKGTKDQFSKGVIAIMEARLVTHTEKIKEIQSKIDLINLSCSDY